METVEVLKVEGPAPKEGPGETRKIAVFLWLYRFRIVLNIPMAVDSCLEIVGRTLKQVALITQSMVHNLLQILLKTRIPKILIFNK